jgi:DNA-binding transcriptional ArsR family regulator
MNKKELRTEINSMHASLCSAVSDPTRIMIIYELQESPQFVGQLAESLGVSHSATSRHLKILKSQEIVRSERSGHHVKYFLNTPELIEALEIFRSVLNDQLERRANLINNQRKGLD